MSGVILSKIVKNFGSLQVVHGIDLEVKPKEFIVLVGPSGCGKSTTLRMIAGLEEITSGSLSIGGRLVNRIAPKDRDVAMVFQNYALYPHLNVADNIAFGLRIRRVAKKEVARSVEDVAKILDLTEYLQRKPSELSGGQRQRVAMGRAIVRHPQVFLFDEPLSNLDAKLRTQMRAEIRRLHNRLGVTSIYVTHDQVEAMTLADRIVVMREGRIEQIGAPMELFNNPVNTFVAGFIGSPAMNQFEAVIEAEASAPVAVIENARIRLPPLRVLADGNGRRVIIGIRPEHCSVHPIENASAIPVELDLVETLGSEALLHARVGDAPFVVKTETGGRTDHLSNVREAYVTPEHIKVFDLDTGRVLEDAVVERAA